MFLTLNALTTVWLSITSAFQWLAERDVGTIELTAWIHALSIIITSARIHVSSIIINASQFLVLKHALDTEHSARTVAIRMVALKNPKGA
jgi:hypothetical protein